MADECKAKAREALVHTGDQAVDLLEPVAAHQRIDVAGVAGPALAKELPPKLGVGFVPCLQIVAGDGGSVWHVCPRGCAGDSGGMTVGTAAPGVDDLRRHGKANRS